MRWHDFLTGLAFRQWILEVAGGTRIRQGQPLDPFGTSMRDFKPVSEWLATVEHGQSLPGRGGSGVQDATDLKSTLLVEAQDDGSLVLTDFGSEVLAGWREHEVANSEQEDELVRCVIFANSALRRAIPKYESMFSFWAELRDLYEPESLFDAHEVLYLVSYLKRDVDGYNPWLILKTSGAEIGDVLESWDDLLENIPEAEAVVTSAAEKLKTRVRDFGTRGAGRQVFCMAMELVLVAQSAASDIPALLDNWTVPVA